MVEDDWSNEKLFRKVLLTTSNFCAFCQKTINNQCQQHYHIKAFQSNSGNATISLFLCTHTRYLGIQANDSLIDNNKSKVAGSYPHHAFLCSFDCFYRNPVCILHLRSRLLWVREQLFHIHFWGWCTGFCCCLPASLWLHVEITRVEGPEEITVGLHFIKALQSPATTAPWLSDSQEGCRVREETKDQIVRTKNQSVDLNCYRWQILEI